MMTVLRPYQQKGLDDIRAYYAKGERKVLLHLATGGGKTVVFSEVLKGCYSKKKRAIMVVRGKALVDQASQRLFRENVPHGVLMAGHWNKRPHEMIQICSIDTLRSRQIVPDADLVVIDEAHFAGSSSFRWLVEAYPVTTYFLAVTATPHVSTGLRHVANVVVYPITMRELIEQGFLVKPKYFSVPTDVDFSKLKIDKKTGDFIASEVDGLMANAKIVGDIVKTWKERGENRPTVCFATSINNSKQIVAEFKAAGIPAEHIEANDGFEIRKQAIEDLKTGKIKILSNVGILCTGVDIPFLSCLIMARPTASYNLYIQQLGRGTRISEGKENFIVLDHGKNVIRHGFIEDEKECDLDGTTSQKKKVDEPALRIITCKICYFSFKPNEKNICPECGFSNYKPPAPIIHRTDIDLVEIKTLDAVNSSRVLLKVEKLITTAIKRGYKPGWVFHQIRQEFGEIHAKKHWTNIKSSIDAASRQFGESNNSSPQSI
jgi:superfamily II DNA or RNA helicase